VNLQSILNVSGSIHLSVCAIENQRPSCLNSRSGNEWLSIEWILIVLSSWHGIRLGYGAGVYDLELERRFLSVLVRGEIGIIGLEGYVEISIFLRLGRVMVPVICTATGA